MAMVAVRMAAARNLLFIGAGAALPREASPFLYLSTASRILSRVTRSRTALDRSLRSAFRELSEKLVVVAVHCGYSSSWSFGQLQFQPRSFTDRMLVTSIFLRGAAKSGKGGATIEQTVFSRLRSRMPTAVGEGNTEQLAGIDAILIIDADDASSFLLDKRNGFRLRPGPS